MTAKVAQPEVNVTEVLGALAGAGIHLAPNGSRLRCWSNEPLSQEMRATISAHKPAILSYFAIWNLNRAIALASEADGLVAELDVPGTDPEILAAVECYSAAFFAHDMLGIRAAVFAVEMRARALAARQGAPGRANDPANAQTGSAAT
jgi:hypothetical protein